jgi:hypothetical protein
MKFSTFWARSASALASTVNPWRDCFERRDLQRGRRAHPLPGRDVRANQQTHAARTDAVLAVEDHQPAEDVGAPGPARIAREQRPRRREVERRLTGGELGERERHARFRPGIAELVALDDDLLATGLLRRHQGRDRQRQLQHQRARIVGDPTHQIETAWRARQHQRPMRIEECRPGGEPGGGPPQLRARGGPLAFD